MTIANKSSENILGIDFLQKFWLHLEPQHKRGHLPISTLQSTIRHKKLLNTSFCHHSSTCQNIPDHKQPAALHRRHRRTKATFDIWTLNTSQFRQQKSVYYANPELRSTRGQYQHRQHTRHPEYRKRGPNSF